MATVPPLGDPFPVSVQVQNHYGIATQMALVYRQSFIPPPPPPPPGGNVWTPLRIGAGGFTRDIDIAPDGTKVCKVDVYGAYVWNPTAPSSGNAGGLGIWQQLCRPPNIPAGDPAYTAANVNSYAAAGAWDIRIAPSNSNVIYMMWLGMMYRSANKGVTFVNQTNNAGGTFPLQTPPNVVANNQINGPGPTMAIDPQNANVCWTSSLGGVFFTQDGGTTWSTLSTTKLPLPTGVSTYGFAFDPLSAFTSSKTQGIYAFVSGSGVYHSADAGSNWSLLTSGPTDFYRIIVDKFGVAWILATTGAHNLWNYTVQIGTAFTANTWHNSTSSPGIMLGVACDPASSSSTTQRVILTGSNGTGANGGSVSQTLDGGTTWTPAQSTVFNQVATDIPWLQTNEAYMTMDGNIVFDPSQSNALYFPEGIGVWVANLPSVSGGTTWPAWNWVSQSAGIESLDTTYIFSPPGGAVNVLSWDRNYFRLPTTGSTATFPSIYGTWPGSRVNGNINQAVIFGGNGGDWAGQTPSFLAVGTGFSGTTAGQRTGSTFSTDGGVTWSFYTNDPPSLGSGYGNGAVAVSTPTSTMLVANGLFVTTDNGATAWRDVTPAGSSGWANGFVQGGNQLAADKVTANYYVAAGGGNKIYVSSNSGTLWTNTATLSSSGFAGTRIKAVPSNALHYFWCAGATYQGLRTDNIFYHSTDGGVTWVDVSQAGYTVAEVWDFGIGAPNGGTYPTIFIYGYVNSVVGVWQSVDNCVSWQKIGDAQFGGTTFDLPNCMSGDMNRPGVVYVGFLGSGYLQYGP